MSLTAWLVTRNHADCLGRAIRSVRESVTRVVVVDTGSTDCTVELAREAGATVVAIDWHDDFSAACNLALNHADTNWILSLNPDEELEPAGARMLPIAIENGAAFAYRVRVQQVLQPDGAGSGTSGWEPRLIRRDPALRYRGRLHPTFVTPLQELAAARGQSVPAIEIVIRRHAYLSKPTPDKLRWAVRLIEAELRDRPGQLHFLIELGRHLLWLDDPRGHQVLAEAADQVRAAATAASPPHPDVGQLLEYLLSVSPEQSRCRITREEARELARRWFPRTPPVLWALAAERFAAGDYRAAIDPLGRLIHLGRSGDYDSGGGFDPAILGPDAQLNLGLCFHNLGDWAAARACFGPLVSDPVRGGRAARLYAHAEDQERKKTSGSAGQ